MPFLTIRSWLLYACAWLPYIASYYLIFRLQRPGDGLALIDALANVLPAAVLGLIVFVSLRKLPWPTTAPFRFALAHTFLCAAYTALWLGLETLCLSLVYGLYRGRWHLPTWNSYSLQWQAFSGVMIYVTLAGLFYMVSAQRRAQIEQQKRLEAEALRVRAELSTLRSQLNPHFLFNALHSLGMLVTIDPAKAETAIIDLSKMLRYALASHTSSVEDEVSLREELDFVNAYLTLESLRLGSRLSIERVIAPDSLDCALPSLTLQPLVENAIKHSIAPRAHGGQIRITADVLPHALVLKVTDDGCGNVPDIAHCSGLGLRSIMRRLELYYQNRASVDISSRVTDGFSVTLTIPRGD